MQKYEDKALKELIQAFNDKSILECLNKFREVNKNNQYDHMPLRAERSRTLTRQEQECLRAIQN